MNARDYALLVLIVVSIVLGAGMIYLTDRVVQLQDKQEVLIQLAGVQKNINHDIRDILVEHDNKLSRGG